MLTIKAKPSSDPMQYAVELTRDTPLGVKRAHKSPINNKVNVSKTCVYATTSGEDAGRLCDTIDEVLESYEEEFKDYSRVVNIDIQHKTADTYPMVIDYLLGSLYINHATIDGMTIR